MLAWKLTGPSPLRHVLGPIVSIIFNPLKASSEKLKEAIVALVSSEKCSKLSCKYPLRTFEWFLQGLLQDGRQLTVEDIQLFHALLALGDERLGAGKELDCFSLCLPWPKYTTGAFFISSCRAAARSFLWRAV